MPEPDDLFSTNLSMAAVAYNRITGSDVSEVVAASGSRDDTFYDVIESMTSHGQNTTTTTTSSSFLAAAAGGGGDFNQSFVNAVCHTFAHNPSVTMSYHIYVMAAITSILVGLVGNTLSVLVFSSREMLPFSSNVYLLALALSDSLYLVSVLLSKVGLFISENPIGSDKLFYKVKNC